MPAEYNLERFLTAQAPVYGQALAELRDGCKRSHWMWFVFPQLAGLGRSSTAQYYALRDVDQARRYLADPVLSHRLRQCVQLMLQHRDKTAHDILGSPDDTKFRSCLTLFQAAAIDPSDHSLFGEALRQFYDGVPDARTLQLLEMG
jgi:uncharacterized protein (DUF1810 family)